MHGIRIKGPKSKKHKRTISNDDLLALLLSERKKHLRLAAGVPDGAAVDLPMIKLPNGVMRTDPAAPQRSDLISF